MRICHPCGTIEQFDPSRYKEDSLFTTTALILSIMYPLPMLHCCLSKRIIKTIILIRHMRICELNHLAHCVSEKPVFKLISTNHLC